MSPTVVVQGHGEVSVVPDALRLELAAECEAAGVSDALTQARRALAGVRTALRDLGVAPDDLRTSGLNVWQRFGDGSQETVGYTATESLSVLLRDLGHVDAVLAASVEVAGNALRVHGLSFEVVDPADALDRARRRAVEDARRAAAVYAGAVGCSVGDVVRVTDGATAPGPVGKSFASVARSGGGVEAGVQVVAADVTVEWTLL